MFKKFFDPDNGLMVFMSHISDFIFLSMLWVLCCFPVVTIGAATAALYDATVRSCRQGDRQSWQRFFAVLKNNLKPGLLPTAAFLAVFAACARVLILVWNGAVAGGTVSWTLFSAAALVGLVALGMLSVLFPMLSRFENSCAGLLKNMVLLALVNLPRTMSLGIVNAVALYLCARYVIPLFFVPSLAALAGSFFLEPMFQPYMDEDAS